PFWPMGTGIARGFLAAMDTAWMVRSWGQGNTPSQVLAERESVYRLLPQTTPENVSKNHSQYSMDPASRYPNINMQLVGAAQVCHLIDTGEAPVLSLDAVSSPHPRLTRQESVARYSKLLSWCQEQTLGYMNVCVTDFTTSWRSGLALCALIHRFRPDLIDFASLEESEAELNGQLGLDMAEQEFGICPIMTGKEMSTLEESDSLSMVMYLSQLYELLKDTAPAGGNLSSEEKAVLFSSTSSPISLLSKLGQSLSRKRNPKDKKEKEADSVGKRRRTSQTDQSEEEDVPHDTKENKTSELTPGSEPKVAEGHSKVRSMATQLLAKFEENSLSASATATRRQSYIQMYTGGVSSLAQQIANQIQSQQDQAPMPLHRRELGSRKEFPVNMGGSDVCYFCGRRVYVMERLSAEGKFFHRSCFQCDHCSTTLRLSNYAYDQLHGKFYCKHHFSFRMAQRKRPAPPVAPRPTQAPPAPSSACTSLSSLGSVCTATPPDSWSSIAHSDMVSSLAKRLCGTPERIELENYKPCPKQQDSPLQEVPEETLAQHNLSASVQEKKTEEQSSSSESDLEEEELAWKKEEGPNIRTNGERELDLGKELKEEEGGENQENQEEEEEEEEQDEGDSSDESFEGYSDDTDIDTSSDGESKPCDQKQQEESPPSLKPPESGPTPTPELSTNPENPPVKSLEVVEEFWLKSAEIRKSLGLTPLPRECDRKHTAAQTSNIKENFYTSVTYIPSCNTNSAYQMPRNCDSSTQTQSQSTSPPEPSHTTDGDAAVALEETRGRCSVIHRLSITVEGCVMGDKQDLDLNSTSFGNESVLNPDTGLPTPSYSPSHSPRALHHSEPILGREVMVFSSTCAIPVPQRDGFNPHLDQASLPPDEIEILCGDEAEEASRLPERSCVSETEDTAGQMDNRRLEHRRTLPDRMVAPLLAGGPEVRLRKSEMKLWGADTRVEEKEKKYNSLFSPCKNSKSVNAVAETQREPGKHKSLWKTVFSVHKKDKKRKEAVMVAETQPAATNTESKRKVSGINKTSDLCFRKNPSFSEDTDLSCHALLERCPLRAQRAETEEELNAKLTRRVQRAVHRQAKQEELRRLHRAQIIQRQLEQVEVKQRQLEEKGVAVEKALRGEAGMGKKDDPSLMHQWFKLVQEKNALVRYESELMILYYIHARELELEDRQSRLQQELRERMAVDDHLKGDDELVEERRILSEMLDVVEQRNALVVLLEEQRVREKEEDSDLEAVMLSKGFSLHWD
ncbi:hypothetical protein cypCar_00026786, partial [Cyprinus carpio]